MDTQPQNTQTPAPTTPGGVPGESWPGAASSRAGRNFALLLAFGIVFLGVASVVKPDPRGASASTNRAYNVPAPANQEKTTPMRVLTELAAQQHPKGWKLVGMLEAKNYLVLIHAGASEPMYSVFGLDGRLLKGDMPADDVYREFPDLDLKTLRLDPPATGQASETGPLMLAEPVRSHDDR